MVDWAKLLNEKINTARRNWDDELEFEDAMQAVASSVAETFSVHDSVTDEELEQVWIDVQTIVRHDEAHRRFEKECERLGI
jgi:hypothetical protein